MRKADDAPPGDPFPRPARRRGPRRRASPDFPWVVRALWFVTERYLVILSVAVVVAVLAFCMTVLLDFRTPEQMDEDARKADRAAGREVRHTNSAWRAPW